MNTTDDELFHMIICRAAQLLVDKSGRSIVCTTHLVDLLMALMALHLWTMDRLWIVRKYMESLYMQ